MRNMRSVRFIAIAVVCGLFAAAITVRSMEQVMQPKVGEKAPDFTLKTLDMKEVKLSKVIEDGPAVVVMLRGWPGYQCPICKRQVGDFIGQAEKFKEAKAQVVMVYPGPSEYLDDHAKEFAEMQKESWPDNVTLVLDPDYTMTNAYGLRWDAEKETAYPSTFVVDQEQKVQYAKISKEHGGRTSAEEVVKAVQALGMEGSDMKQEDMKAEKSSMMDEDGSEMKDVGSGMK